MELARMAGVGERKLFFTVQGGGEEEGVQEVRGEEGVAGLVAC